MTSKPPGSAAPHVVGALARTCNRNPLERKLVVATTGAAVRELLRRLSLSGFGWIGFEVTTPRPLALRLARPGMERSGLAAVDAFDTQALLDEAMDAALAMERPELGRLSDGVGFRERAHGAVQALRLAGVDAARLDRVRLRDWTKRRFLHRMLERYEQLLAERRRVDTAGVFVLALEALEAEGGRLPAHLGSQRVLLFPGLGTRGLPGKLISAMGARGAKVLETDPVIGLETPPRVLWKPAKKAGPRSYLHAPEDRPEQAPVDLQLFRAASVTDELKEVLRRAIQMGHGWDQVEIVTPDPAAYGSALHALSTRLRIPVTYAVGLPLQRTRTGRVVRAYLDWIEEGFQAEAIRRLLEAGDLEPPRSRRDHTPAALSRRFRTLRVGWGRKRYRTQIRAALAGVDRMTPRGRESKEAFERRVERRRSELEALRSILFPALRETPAVPDTMGEGGERVSPAELARGLRAFLRRVPPGTGPDGSAREEVERVLERVEATLARRTEFRAALTILRRHLDVRVGTDRADRSPNGGLAPWSSEGGHLYLSDLEHGGFSGRAAVFIVGLDADRLPGFAGQDPVLLDGDRRILSEELPTSLEILREHLFRFAALFARLAGSVTLSHCAWDAREARELGPSPLLLQALRLTRADASLTFEDLEDALGAVASAVPGPGRPALDGDDVWMAELGHDGVLRSGVETVSAAFPSLGEGLDARRTLRDGVPGAVHGVVQPRPDVFDPRRNPSLVVSASRLEALGTCPLRYLHRDVLRIRPPDDPELDPERWLDALRRGALLHQVFERTLRATREQGVDVETDAFESLANAALEVAIRRMRSEMPVPGEGALRREKVGLENDVRSFVRMVREQGAPWVALELRFGLGQDEPVVMETPLGSLRVRGAIDRVDEDLAGVHVIDYKTGVARDFAGTGTYNGGRRLQHAIYTCAAEARLGGRVASGEYHFPTMRGENRRLTFERAGLTDLGELLDRMLDGVAEGSFVPTDSSDDCRYCDFADICRVRTAPWGSVLSPLAEWSREHLNTGLWPAFAALKRVRKFEG